ncbi:MAG: DUF3105 domain-containing protein [Actinomycetota bacterium]
MPQNPETKKVKREAARKARLEAQLARERAKKRKRLGMIAGALVLVLLVAFAVNKRSESSGRNIAELSKKAGCGAVESIKELPAGPHLSPGAPAPKYNSVPPTSGLHLPSPGPWGSQDTTVDNKILVHNLEHGGVVLHYKGASDKEIDELNTLADDTYVDGVIVQPNPKIKAALAMTSWGKLQNCKKISIPVIKAFIKSHCNKGPEKLGLSC